MVTGVAQVLFPHQANGSPIEQNGTVVGSELIGQPFSDPSYFWGRPSATPSFEYNASYSTGTNYGPNESRFGRDGASEGRCTYMQWTRTTPNPYHPTWSPHREVGWTRTSAWPAPCINCPGWPESGT